MSLPKGSKCPKHSKWMKEHHPMKGKKNPDLSRRMREDNPLKRMENRERQSERNRVDNPMKRPEVRAKFIGENNPSKRSDVRAKMKDRWTPKRKERVRERMKNGGAAHANSFNKSPSKVQVQLYEKVKIFYPSAVLNYPHRNYSIDIAIPEYKIAIEFDGWFWHKNKQEYDKKRQAEIEKDGWKFIRYSKLPNSTVLNKDLSEGVV